MAVVDGPLFSNQATGSMGPLTYCYANGGNSVRARVSPNNVRSTYQGEYRRNGLLRVAFEWSNETQLRRNQWYELAVRTRRTNRLGKSIRSNGRNEFMSISIPVQYYAGGGQPAAASPLGPTYYPEIACTWTGSGLSLSWDSSIPTNGLIVVRQWRNLTVVQNRWQKFVTSHVFDSSYSSPQLISPAASDGDGPRYLPAVVASSYFIVEVVVIAPNARRMPPLRFRVQAA